jgi:hypothetical protein
LALPGTPCHRVKKRANQAGIREECQEMPRGARDGQQRMQRGMQTQARGDRGPAWSRSGDRLGTMPRKTSKKTGRWPKSKGSGASKVGPNSGRIPDKQPMRAPRRPEGARYERSGRTGRMKRRLGG